MKNIMQNIFNFLEKHSKFIKKILLFTIIYFILCVVNSSDLLIWVEKIFGEYLSIGFQAFFCSFLVFNEV